MEQNERHQILSKFMGIWGAGETTAEMWYQWGMRRKRLGATQCCRTRSPCCAIAVSLLPMIKNYAVSIYLDSKAVDVPVVVPCGFLCQALWSKIFERARLHFCPHLFNSIIYIYPFSSVCEQCGAAEKGTGGLQEEEYTALISVLNLFDCVSSVLFRDSHCRLLLIGLFLGITENESKIICLISICQHMIPSTLLAIETTALTARLQECWPRLPKKRPDRGSKSRVEVL